MTAEQINEVLKQRDPEWIRSFMELAKQYEGATPEHREKALEFLRERKGYISILGLLPLATTQLSIE